MIDTYEHTSEQTWDTIAYSFDTTRQKPWQIVLDFLQTLPHSASVIDLGCGNGRHLLACAQHCTSVVGFDISRNLLSIAREKTQKLHNPNTFFVHGTVTCLPFKDNSFDGVLFIASLHNIKGKNKRKHALRELHRILKPGGIGLISVWSRWQKNYRFYFFKELFFQTQREFGDIEIPWKQHTTQISRFYHLYGQHEFIHDIKSSGLIIEKIVHEKIKGKPYSNNYFAFIRK
ncbi:MAG: class I SAM-dependent methyltransferase [Candidatus Thermoplasmatota archaeon]